MARCALAHTDALPSIHWALVLPWGLPYAIRAVSNMTVGDVWHTFRWDCGRRVAAAGRGVALVLAVDTALRKHPSPPMRACVAALRVWANARRAVFLTLAKC